MVKLASEKKISEKPLTFITLPVRVDGLIAVAKKVFRGYG